MMHDAHVTEAELQAYVDGRLDGARVSAVETWLAAHPEQLERIQELRRMGEELRAHYESVTAEPVPERLLAVPRVRRWTSIGRVATWMGVGLLVGAAAGWQLHDRRSGFAKADAAEAIARRAAQAHATYSPEVRHPVEVGADQEAHLVAWLSKRLGANVRAPKLENVGYSLVGGRLLPGESGPVAQFMYQCHAGTRVTLYVRTDVQSGSETAFRYAKEGNVRVYYWVDRKLGYAMSTSDISKDDLLKVSNAVYQQLNP
ncbi:MAG TPA: anti-sigma factor [Burkholderiales bacterium]|nr:anti-sigma factor [Burkholderiales bacterium]